MAKTVSESKPIELSIPNKEIICYETKLNIEYSL